MADCEMILRFSIIVNNIEVFVKETETMKKSILEVVHATTRLFIIIASQSNIEKREDGTQHLTYFNMTFYFRNYDEFSLNILADEILDKMELNRLFEVLSKEVTLILNSNLKGRPISKLLGERLEPILAPLTQDPLTEVELQYQLKTKMIPKIALAGLGNAGKSSIKNVFFNNWTKIMVHNIQATIGIDYSKKIEEFLDQRFVIQDFGGQVAYREQHLSKIDNWRDISALIYVLDIQDSDLFEESKKYLLDIWKIITPINDRKPKLSIFLHKYDVSKREKLKKNLSEFLKIFTPNFGGFASYYTTTIEDSSSNVALIRSIYFAFPEIILPKLLETEFLHFFEKEIISINSLYFRNKESTTFYETNKARFEKSAELLGVSCGMAFQKKWLEILTEQSSLELPESTTSPPEIIQKDRTVIFKVKNPIDDEIPLIAWRPLLNRFLVGIIRTFQLPPPIMNTEASNSTTWEIKY